MECDREAVAFALRLAPYSPERAPTFLLIRNAIPRRRRAAALQGHLTTGRGRVELSDRVRESDESQRGARRQPEGRRPVLKKPLEPALGNRGVKLMLVTQGGNRHLVDQVPPQDGYFLFRGVMLTLVAREPSPLYLSQRENSPFPAEAGQEVHEIYSLV